MLQTSIGFGGRFHSSFLLGGVTLAARRGFTGVIAGGVAGVCAAVIACGAGGVVAALAWGNIPPVRMISMGGGVEQAGL